MISKDMIDKMPRWALVVCAFFGLGSMGILVSTARADLDKFKTIAYQAKNVSEDNTESIKELKTSVGDIRASQEQFRREYRQDQKDLDSKLTELLKAVKA